MQVAFIEPVQELAEFSLTDMHMILPEVLHNPVYLDYFLSVKGHKILDNGAAEGRVATKDMWTKLVEEAQMVGADEVVVPDVMGNSGATQRMAVEFAQWVMNEGALLGADQFKWMGVAHGNSLQEVVACIHLLAQLDIVTVLGLPRIIANNIHKWARISILESDLMNDLIPNGFPGGIHCLGGARWGKEAILLADYPVRSIDTSYVAAMSLAGHDINTGTYVSRPRDFWSRRYGNDRRLLADMNHMKYLEWCNAVS